MPLCPHGRFEMPKFYVLSGEIEEVLNAENPMDACVQVVQIYEEDDVLWMDFAVSERGFGHNSFDPEADHVIQLVEVLQNIGRDSLEE